MYVSVIIPTRNNGPSLQERLFAILEQDLTVSAYEVIVVDNGSTDNTMAVLQSLRGRYSHLQVEFEATRGPGAARNRGIGIARGELLLFMDDDIIVQRDHVRRHRTLHEDGDTFLCIVNCVQNEASSDYPPLDEYLAKNNLIGARMPASGQEGISLVSQDFSLCRAAMERIQFVLNGRTQYFDESFVMRQDGELGIRLQQQGVKFRFVENIPARHVQHYTRSQFAERSRLAGYYSRRIYDLHPETALPISHDRSPTRVLRELSRLVGLTAIHLFPGFGASRTAARNLGVELWMGYHIKSGYYQAVAEERRNRTHESAETHR